MKNIVWLVLFGAPLPTVVAQKIITLTNPSFEASKTMIATVPTGWINVGLDTETPPDIQPGWFGVALPAQDGHTYLGLVVRDNNTWEGVGQQLTNLLKKDETYTFSVYLNRSQEYVSATKTSPLKSNFDAPTVLRIWGYNTETEHEELLAESSAVSSLGWTLYSFELHPTKDDFNELDLTAYYAPGSDQRNGHLLVDNCSSIVQVTK